jgi:DNA helicase-2/ATP-dependent DNA helicase PcrA
MSVGGRGYWGRQVVRDLCAWLAALANPRDEAALYGVLASPLVGLSSDALAHIAGAAGTGNAWRAIAGDGALRARLTEDDRVRLEIFTARFAAERALAPRLGLDELLRRVVDATGYDLHVLSLAGGERRLANIHKLLRLAADFERDRGRDVRGLADLATAELEAEARETDAPVELGDVKAVRLMSVHAAKGLEFPVVAMIGLEEGVLPHSRARGNEAELEEERRLAFVGITRAQEKLILSKAAYRTIRGLRERTVSSPFLNELSQQDLDVIDRSGASGFGGDDDDDEGYGDGIRQQMQRESDQLGAQFKRGQLVRHKMFGLGRVAEITPMGSQTRAIIEFNTAGRKTLILEYAKLEAVSQ